MLNKLIKNKNRKGFTIIEILVVIVVVGILFRVFLPRIDFVTMKARETNISSDFRTYQISGEQLIRENSGLIAVKSGSTFTLDKSRNLVAFNKLLDPANAIKDGTVSFAGGAAIFGAGSTATYDGETTINDPWNMPYQVKAVRHATASGVEYKLFIDSYGKTQQVDIPDYRQLIHYTNGQLKTCSAGFEVDGIVTVAKDLVVCP